jgi:hypothetical protein
LVTTKPNKPLLPTATITLFGFLAFISLWTCLEISVGEIDIMQIQSYPDKSYICDGEIQRTVSRYVAFRDRFFWRSGVVMFGCIAGVIISRLIGIPNLVWGFVALIGIVFILVLALVYYTPRPLCPHCGIRMKRRYTKRSRGPSDELFIVCDSCKIYADAHTTRE